MYLKELKIWNFRKFSQKSNEEPGLRVGFNDNLNIIIGENDSGKSTIIDAIKLTLSTTSDERKLLTEKDFHNSKNGKHDNIRIECVFSDLNEQEAGIFLEWLTFDEQKNYQLEVRFTANIINEGHMSGRIFKTTKAGPSNADFFLDGLAKEIIKATYLKPLRDAENELKPGISSRLAQILRSHKKFKSNDDETHPLEEIMLSANEKLKEYFDSPYDKGRTLIGDLSTHLDEFFSKPKHSDEIYSPKFEVSKTNLQSILKRLSLELDDNTSGLGSLNLLFIAAELLLLNDKDFIGSNLTIVEEIEAHLHPQAQLRLLKYLQESLVKNGEVNNTHSGQFILSTHSPSLVASTPLENVILISDSEAYPMDSNSTKLDKEDYEFLERFLDVTKSNLFFARGVILVEGDAENLLIPTIAEIIGRPLHKYGVSIVNLGNTAFNRYSKIFCRSDDWLNKGLPDLKLPVSLITDLDIKPIQQYSKSAKQYSIENQEQLINLEDKLELNTPLNFDNYSFEDKVFEKISDIRNEINFLYGSNLKADKNEDIDIICGKSVTKEFLEELEKRKIERLKKEYSRNSNLKVFISPKWTLEYSLALSSINVELAKSIHEARFKEPYNNRNAAVWNTMREDIVFGDNESADLAYKIFKPLHKKNVSKAVVAQLLAKSLKEKSLDIKSEIEDDEYLSYIIDAIYHVTEPKLQEEK
ncbi:AAA family ATPase [Alkalihalobacillus sp. FSL R5-0424]